MKNKTRAKKKTRIERRWPPSPAAVRSAGLPLLVQIGGPQSLKSRMVAIKAAGAVRLVSRNGRDHTRRFAEIVKALDRLKAKTFTLDGEVAVFDKALISRFEWLRGRPANEPATLPVYMVFDLLELARRDLRKQPLRERRRLLNRLVSSPGMVFTARRLDRNGLKAWREALERGYEGIVAKDPESRYIPGRTLSWLKVKQKNYRKEERGFYHE